MNFFVKLFRQNHIYMSALVAEMLRRPFDKGYARGSNGGASAIDYSYWVRKLGSPFAGPVTFWGSFRCTLAVGWVSHAWLSLPYLPAIYFCAYRLKQIETLILQSAYRLIKGYPLVWPTKVLYKGSRSLATNIASSISTSKYKRCNNFDIRKILVKESMERRMDSATLGYELAGNGLTTLEWTYIAPEWWCASDIIRQLIKHLSNTTYWLTSSSTHIVHCSHFEIQQFEFTLAFLLCANIFLNLIIDWRVRARISCTVFILKFNSLNLPMHF